MGKGWQRRLWVLGLAMGIPGGALGFEARAVRTARLSYLAGTVTVERVDNTGRDQAVLNMPLPEGTRVLTAGDGQVEIEFEDGSVLRETPNSALTLTSLGADGSGNYLTRVDVLHGLIYAELRAAARYQYLIEAGDDAISPMTNATVRIQFDQPPALMAVLDGSVRVTNGVDAETTQGGFETELKAGESLRDDPSDAGRYLLSQTIEKDLWDTWNEDRDQMAANEASARTSARNGFAGDQGYGWSDLDANGSWYDVPGQGQVWQPSVAAGGTGFDPYGYGNWVWYPANGYVWSSGYNWGWTPFQCGNWNYFHSFGWGWSPGASCGVIGGRFGGGGFPVNIAHGPTNYRPPKPPVPGPVKVHPLVPVNLTGLHDGSISPGAIHDGSLSGTLQDGSLTGTLRDGSIAGQPANQVAQDGLPGSGFVGTVGGVRTIGGQTVYPLAPIRTGDTLRVGNVVGSSLRRDFPVDRTSHQALMGVQGAPAAVRPVGGVSPGVVTNWPSGRGWEANRGGGAGAVPGLVRMPPPAPLARPMPPGVIRSGPAPVRSLPAPAAAHPPPAAGHR